MRSAGDGLPAQAQERPARRAGALGSERCPTEPSAPARPVSAPARATRTAVGGRARERPARRAGALGSERCPTEPSAPARPASAPARAARTAARGRARGAYFDGKVVLFAKLNMFNEKVRALLSNTRWERVLPGVPGCDMRQAVCVLRGPGRGALARSSRRRFHREPIGEITFRRARKGGAGLGDTSFHGR